MDVREGDRLRVAVDGYVAGVLVTYAAPYTGGADKVIPRGTELVVTAVVEDRPGFWAEPVDYKAMEKVLVDRNDRRGRYDGYYLVCLKADVGTSLERVVTG